MRSGRPLIEAEDLSFHIDSVALLRNVGLSVYPGEVVGIIGPNGAGKSTLLGNLGGDLTPTSGTVNLGQRPVGEFSPAELALQRSILSQHIPADIDFTARAVVAMGRFPHRHDPANSQAADTQAIDHAMHRTSTAGLANRTFFTLSGGERTRVSLARILAQDTPLLLLDEPTTALDIAHRERIMSEIRALAQSKKGVVAVMHDLNIAAFFTDRLLLLAGGELLAEGEPREVLDEDLLTAVYEQEMRVIPHPFRDCPLVLVTD